MAEPVTIGGELVHPGDVVRGDADGVVIVRREDVADVIDKAQEREDAETAYIAAYRAGRGVIEVSDLGAKLAAKGLVIDE
jgi:4-hydroxy-4-methyl-2-oxoglutarate aldolase